MNSLSEYRKLYPADQGYKVGVVKGCNNEGIFLEGENKKYDFAFPAGGLRQMPENDTIIALRLTSGGTVKEYYTLGLVVIGKVETIMREGGQTINV